MKFKDYLKTHKPVIGMLHLAGISEQDMLDRAKLETDAYLLNGVDAVLVENYFGSANDCETVLKWLQSKRPEAMYGVNILGDFECAFRLAAEYGARFIQIDSVCGHLPPGRDEAFAEKLNALRADCPAAVLGGVRFKYQPVLSERSVEEDLKLGMERCDAIVVTGDGTGVATPWEKILEFHKVVGDFPLVVGAGVTADTVAESLAICDGAIVGSWFKNGHRDTGDVNGDYVRLFMDEAKKAKPDKHPPLNVRHTVVFAERIAVHGRTPLSAVPAPILGDIYVRAARMRGEDAVQILGAEGPSLARLDYARTLRAFLVADDGLFIEDDPEKHLRPWRKHDDPTLNHYTEFFREATGPAIDPSRGLARLAKWRSLAGHEPKSWITSSETAFVLPWFKGSVAQGATGIWIDTFAKAGAASVPMALPLGHLNPVPANACADAAASMNLLSGGIRARNYLEHFDPQWLRFQLAAWFRGNDRDWQLDRESFLQQGSTILQRGVGRLANLCVALLNGDCGGRLGFRDGKAGELLEALRAKAKTAVKSYAEWNFAEVVKAAYDIVQEGHAFVKAHDRFCSCWSPAVDESDQAC